MRLLLTALLGLSVSIVGCSGETGSVQADVAAVATGTSDGSPPVSPAVAQHQRQYLTTLENFPDWVPLPDEYVVIMAGRAGGARSTVIETGGDPRAVVEHLNAKLTAMELNTIKVQEGGDRFLAQGVITYGLSQALINISEYDAGGAMKPGNTTSISYTIGG